MARITLRFEDDDPLIVEAEPGENLLKLLQRHRVSVQAPCAGGGSCGRCRVQILSGTLQSSKSFYIDDVEYNEGWRLACLSRICGDAELRMD